MLVSRLASEHQSIAGYLACRICLAGMGIRHLEHGCMAYVGIEDDILSGSTATAAVSQRCGAHITRLQGEPRLEQWVVNKLAKGNQATGSTGQASKWIWG